MSLQLLLINQKSCDDQESKSRACIPSRLAKVSILPNWNQTSTQVKRLTGNPTAKAKKEGKPNISRPDERNRQTPAVIPRNGTNNFFNEEGDLVSSELFFGHCCTITFIVPDKAIPEVNAIKKPISSRKYGGFAG
jgi:hypothetical protein